MEKQTMEKPYGRKGEFLLLLKKNKQNNIREVAEQPRKKTFNIPSYRHTVSQHVFANGKTKPRACNS